MKRTLIAIGALGAVLALILTSLVIGIGSDDPNERHIEEAGPKEDSDLDFFEAWPSSLEEEEEPAISYNFFEAWPSNLEEGPDDMGEVDAYPDEAGEVGAESTAPRFSKLVKRSYDFLTREFISQYSHWEKLPAVKTIFTANSSGEWMYKALPRINATGEARIIDRNGDGYPELVIWKHYQRNLTASMDQVNRSRILIQEHAEDIDLTRIAVHGTRGFTLVYVDVDGDAYPEKISLNVSNSFKVNIDDDNIPELVHSFRWYGITRDRDDDGSQDVQKMKVSIRTVLNINNDRIPELRRFEKVHYSRTDTRGRPMWDTISVKVNKGMSFDPNSDGYPTNRKHLTLNGRWLDTDGDGWPQLTRISKKISNYHDKNSDGNPEMRNNTVISASLMDRNDDRYPELVVITYKNVKRIDRNSDGRVDVIEIHSKIFKWIDRNSDGIPERVIMSETYETIHPQNDKERPELEPRKRKPEEEKPKERPEDDREENRTERQEPEQRPDVKREEEKESDDNEIEPEKKREMNGQLSSRP